MFYTQEASCTITVVTMMQQERGKFLKSLREPKVMAEAFFLPDWHDLLWRWWLQETVLARGQASPSPAMPLLDSESIRHSWMFQNSSCQNQRIGDQQKPKENNVHIETDAAADWSWYNFPPTFVKSAQVFFVESVISATSIRLFCVPPTLSYLCTVPRTAITFA